MSRRLRSPVLVARAAQMAMLDALMVEAAAGRGAVVIVRGEPGVGKSRLLSECVDRAREVGLATLSGRAVEGGGAYRPIVDALLARKREAALPEPAEIGPFAPALARLVPRWSEIPGDEPVPDLSLLVSEGLVRLLRLVGRDGGVLLTLDDLHWADADTLTVLDRLADSVLDAPVLVVAAARDHEHRALDRLGVSPSVQMVPLARLSRDEVTALATACAEDPALPAAVHQHVADHADGLPFLVEELLGGLVDSGVLVRTAAGWEAPAKIRGTVPASFAAVVRARLDALDEDARAVVDAAAVVGRRVDWRLLLAVTGLPDSVVLDALRVAVDRQLLAYDGEPADLFRFAHALTREAVLDRLLPPQRITVARAAAGALDELGGELELAAELHATAGDAVRAAQLLSQAAQQAGGAVGTREQLLRRAFELAPSEDIAAALTEVLVLAGRAVEARELGDRVLAQLPRTDTRRRSVALTLARASGVAGRWTQAQRYLGQVGDGPDVRAVAAHVAFAQQRPQDAERLARSAVAAAETPAVLCEALEVVGRCARLRDRRNEAEAAFVRAADIAQRHGLTPWRVRALHELGTLDLLGPACPDRLDEARQLAVAAGLLSTAALVDLQLMGCHGLRVDHDATLSVALRGEDLSLSLRLPVLAGAARLFAAMVYAHTGRHDEMDAALDLALDRVGDDLDLASFAPFIRGVPAMVAHDLAGWRCTLEEGMGLVRRTATASPTPFRGLYALVETVVGDGHAARAELGASGGTVQAANRAALAYADAVAAARVGDDPAGHLAEAEAVMAPLHWRRHHARLLVAPAALRDRWGRPLEWLREANAHFEGAGDAALARACRNLLRAAGAPVPRRGRGDSSVPTHLGALGVTSREIDVLTLVAAGLGNAAIAERLHLSPRTVETHVGHLLAKTGAASRRELANYVAEPG